MVTKPLIWGARRRKSPGSILLPGLFGQVPDVAARHQILLIISGYGERAVICASNLVCTNRQRAADKDVL